MLLSGALFLLRVKASSQRSITWESVSGCRMPGVVAMVVFLSLVISFIISYGGLCGSVLAYIINIALNSLFRIGSIFEPVC